MALSIRVRFMLDELARALDDDSNPIAAAARALEWFGQERRITLRDWFLEQLEDPERAILRKLENLVRHDSSALYDVNPAFEIVLDELEQIRKAVR